MPDARTHYDTLAIPPDADLAQVKRAHRALVRTLHPDVNKAADAAARFKLVQRAYETLSDPHKRAAYDRALAKIDEKSVEEGATHRPHYAWVNIASPVPSREEADEELEEIWRTFFEPRAQARKRADVTRPSGSAARPRKS